MNKDTEVKEKSNKETKLDRSAKQLGRERKEGGRERETERGREMGRHKERERGECDICINMLTDLHVVNHTHD